MKQSEAIEGIVSAYRSAHLDDKSGYSPETHNFLRQDVILHMYEIMLLFRRAFEISGIGMEDLQAARCLEVGCAWGFRLNQLLGFNLQPSQLAGIDLIPEYIDRARATFPRMNFSVMSATRMEFGDKSFDFSFAAMALSAMLDEAIIDASLDEMCRVSKRFVLLIDNFEPAHEDRRNGAVFFRGVSPSRIERLAGRPDVKDVRNLGSFWSTDHLPWRIYNALNRLGLDSLSYALAVRAWPRHSHRAYLISLRQAG
jgi:ubiquinone/menaquinone biosynthesis C-methylase UbiE